MPLTRSNAIDREKSVIWLGNSTFPTVYNRCEGTKPKLGNQPGNRALSRPQEEAVRQWLDQLDRAGQTSNAQQLEICANSILRRQHTDPTTPPPTVSKMWAYRFMKRLPGDYKCQKRKPKEPKRIQSGDVARIDTWYKKIGFLLRQHQIQPGDFYNMDEIGFMEGQG